MKCKHVHNVKTDPTRTLTLRKLFESKMVGRFKNLKKSITEAIVEKDGFGLKVNANEFAFRRDPEKISAFILWLQSESQRKILGITPGVPVSRAAERAWTRIYIDSAYRRGVAQSAQELRRAGVKVADSWVQNAFFRPVHADRAGILYTRAYSDLKGITDEMDKQISRTLSQGIIEGRSPAYLAKSINERVDKIGITRARALARTEIIAAHAEATLNSYEEAGVEGVNVLAEFSTAGDDQVCPECEALEGKEFTIEESHGVIPVHPNCLPGNSLVFSRERITAASKRWFNGEMITIRTASGRELSATPNHPVLTNRGWIALNLLNETDYVISDSGSEWGAAIDRNNKNIPAPIHEIVESFFSSSNVASVPVPISTPDFHGDVSDGDIAIIGTYRSLCPENNSFPMKHCAKFNFVFGNVRLITLACLRSFNQFRLRTFSAAHGIMCRLYLAIPFSLVHLRPLERFGLALCSDTDTCAHKSSPNRIPAHTRLFGNGIFAHAGFVKLRNVFSNVIKKFTSSFIVAPKNPFNNFVTDAELASQLASGESFPVFNDKVVSINISDFSGHVYNLQTDKGYYIAQGIVTHNCRCTFLPVVKDPTGVSLQ